jgi:hypothetical protein
MTPQHLAANGELIEPIDVLKEDLFGIYYGAGRNVTYTADSGKVRPYWPNRYLQGLKRAIEVSDAEVIAYVTRMVLADEPSRGFGYLKDANRLDLTVEAFVADSSRPYHHLFDPDTVQAAIDRLTGHGYTAASGSPSPIADTLSTAAIVRTESGVAVELTVEVTTDGDVLLHAGEYTERVTSTLAATRAFVGLLAQVEAAARG